MKLFIGMIAIVVVLMTSVVYGESSSPITTETAKSFRSRNGSPPILVAATTPRGDVLKFTTTIFTLSSSNASTPSNPFAFSSVFNFSNRYASVSVFNPFGAYSIRPPILMPPSRVYGLTTSDILNRNRSPALATSRMFGNQAYENTFKFGGLRTPGPYL